MTGRLLRRLLRARGISLLAVVLGVLIVMAGTILNRTAILTAPGQRGDVQVTHAQIERAGDALDGLDVAGRAPKTGYSRAQFGLGQGWPATGRGCDTRDQILARDLVDIPVHTGCNITRGTLHDPYTGRTLTLTTQNPKAIEIEHIVALGDAWQKGAQQWTPQERARFAIDPDNLLAVDGPANAAKRDGDAATWLPPNHAYRCTYAVRQITIKTTYRLSVTAAEKAQLRHILAGCPIAS